MPKLNVLIKKLHGAVFTVNTNARNIDWAHVIWNCMITKSTCWFYVNIQATSRDTCWSIAFYNKLKKLILPFHPLIISVRKLKHAPMPLLPYTLTQEKVKATFFSIAPMSLRNFNKRQKACIISQIVKIEECVEAFKIL